MPTDFWSHESMRAAYASRRMGLVIRAYRQHPLRGRSLPQPRVAEALGISQPQVSRIENHGHIQHVDTLVFYARALRIPERFLWFNYPDVPAYADLKAEEPPRTQHPFGTFGAVSAQRTKLLVDAVAQPEASRLNYSPPRLALSQLDEFVGSQAQVCVVEGPPGCGKSELTYEIARRYADQMIIQLHSTDSWHERRADLAAEILRYASIATGGDPHLTVEREFSDLTRSCLIVVDGLKAVEDVAQVGRQVDRLLRQVGSGTLRFVLVVRTPPSVDFSAFPVLAALSFRHDPRAGADQPIALTEWTLPEANQVWNDSRDAGEPSFAELPVRLRELARRPIYMRLLKSSGHSLPPGLLDSYRLVDYCVRALARAGGADEVRTVDLLAEQALAELAEVIPSALLEKRRPPPARHGFAAPGADLLSGPGGASVFGHDIIREYAAATAIASVVAEHGRTTATVAGLNELAELSRSAATARGVLGFLVAGLDHTAPDTLRSLVLAPALSTSHALPLMLAVAGPDSVLLAPDVLRRCAARCLDGQAPLELARALLSRPGLVDALDIGYSSWVVQVLDRCGPDLWADLAKALERHADTATIDQFFREVDIDRPEQATFLASYAHLFVPVDDGDGRHSIAALAGHRDWRVRAALATGMVAGPTVAASPVSRKITDELLRDADYKVRAAIARHVAQLEPKIRPAALHLLLTDSNWHVRACALDSVLDAQQTSAQQLQEQAIAVISGDATWTRCPPYLDRLRQRLLLLAGATTETTAAAAVREQALFTLLREAATGWLPLPGPLFANLRDQASGSDWWLLERERDLALGREPLQAPSARHAFRRLRDQRCLQVALDLRDLDLAADVARAATQAGADLIEVGDPLIKEYGLRAISEVKRRVPDAIVVAEMMSADWGREQVVLAAEAGADVVLLIGPATASSVSAAVAAGGRLGVPILLDVPAAALTEAWIREMERVGVDGFTVTTNIDRGVRGRHPFDNARAIRGWSRLPVAVSGGFSPTDHDIVASRDWDILIIGRSIAEAVDPAHAAREIIDLVQYRRKQE
ncbi:orotidine 5'-phosphate decarboxylase / HUMPS family protein [Actinoplanes sp. NPDC026619]|uniref:orotidine 5'-phosphate decarboxylase / HUMPS family protein n=1 Tax=Actinoplanes sp. NPDC026619 TaxID=3155798 RepID=UPI0033FBBD14